MGKKTHHSVTYYAKELDSCLRDSEFMGRLELGAFNTKIEGKSGETVSFPFVEIGSRVTFRYKIGGPYIFHEMTGQNGKGRERSSTIRKKMDSQKCENLRTYCSEIIENFIIFNIKNFYRQIHPD